MHKLLRLNFSTLARAISQSTRDASANGKKSTSVKTFILTASGIALLGSSLMPGQVRAADEEGVEEVVVTGSRIRRQDFEANSPITTVDNTLFEQTSTVGVET